MFFNISKQNEKYFLINNFWEWYKETKMTSLKSHKKMPVKKLPVEYIIDTLYGRSNRYQIKFKML